MTLQTSTNFTGGNAFQYPNDDGDAYDRAHWGIGGLALDTHTHGSGLGLGVARLTTSTTVAASGGVRINGDDMTWWAATAAAVYTAVNTTAAQTIAGVKTFSAANITLSAAASRIVPGATSLSLRNTANSADNLLITDAGSITTRGDVTMGGQLIATSGLVTAPSLTFSANLVTGLYQTAGNYIDFSTNSTRRCYIDSAGNMVMGTAALATTATNGFIYINSCAGTPTGAATAITGMIPTIYDSTAHKIWFYSGSWRGVAVT